jgi:enterochelin esterase-like enzyme
MQYPVLYMLHGQSFNNDQWDRLGMDEAADRLISSGEIAPFIIVFPQECAYLEDTHTSNYGDAVLTELLPWVESHFPVQADPAHRAIGGLSRGAGWALRLGLSHPEQFGSIGMHSLAQFPGDFYQIPIWRKKPQKKTSPASIWI